MTLVFQRKDWETQSFYNKSWLKIPKNKQFVLPETGLKLVKTTNLAYHTHPDLSYSIIEKTFDNREICELTEVHTMKSLSAFVLPLNTTFFELMKVG